MSDMEQIRKIITSKNLTLNARYLNDDLDMRNEIINLISKYTSEDIKSELINKNHILKYWKLNEHPEYLNYITSLVINKRTKLEECVNTGEYHCLCGRLKNILDKQYMLPDRYPNVFYSVEEDCARLIEQLVVEVIQELQ